MLLYAFMDNPEQRIYQISGERTPEEWNALLANLGELGITAVSVTSDYASSSSSEIVAPNQQLENIQPEIDSYKAVHVIRHDFMEYANEIHELPAMAGRAWNTLTRLYVLKDLAAYYAEKTWYQNADYSYVPLVFDYIPTKDKEGWYNSCELSNLRLDSLKELINLFDDTAQKYRPSVARKMIFGTRVGQGTVEFLRGFIAKHSESTES